jgi:hypothetical protein
MLGVASCECFVPLRSIITPQREFLCGYAAAQTNEGLDWAVLHRDRKCTLPGFFWWLLATSTKFMFAVGTLRARGP